MTCYYILQNQVWQNKISFWSSNMFSALFSFTNVIKTIAIQRTHSEIARKSKVRRWRLYVILILLFFQNFRESLEPWTMQMMVQWEFERSSLVEGLNKWKLIKKTQKTTEPIQDFLLHIWQEVLEQWNVTKESERGAVMKRMLL